MSDIWKNNNDYHNFYIDKSIQITKKITELLQQNPPEETNRKIIDCLDKMEHIDRRTTDDKVSLHFFYQSLITELYKYRDKISWALDTCMYVCDRDISLLAGDEIKQKLRCAVVYSFARKAIYFEGEGRIEEAIEICDMANDTYLDTTRKPYSERKAKLLKKLQK